MGTICFFVERTDQEARYLRRYHPSSDGDAPCPTHGYHDARVQVEDGRARFSERGYHLADEPADPDDPRWPTHCDCGYEFTDEDERQVFADLYYVAPDGQRWPMRELTPGAMFQSWWREPHDVGYDGRSITVRLPDGTDWCIDGQANNCTRKDDRTHRCWVRHGEPPTLTVDKDGDTCAAGAGSILTPNWHGFLRAGVLEPC